MARARRGIALLAATMAAAIALGACGSDEGNAGVAQETDEATHPGLEIENERTSANASSPGTPRRTWRHAPVLPAIGTAGSRRLAREVVRSARAGMRGGVFAKVGDSNSDYPAMLYGLGCREVQFGRHTQLIPTHRRYTAVDLGDVATFPGCRPANSFSRDSAAAASNATTSWALTPVGDPGAGSFAFPPAGCPDRLNPLRCEVAKIRPRWVTLMIGSGDAIFGEPLGPAYAGNLARLIRQVRSMGPVPVIATLPPVGLLTGNENRRIAAANRVVWHVARHMGVPMINVWRAMTRPRMVNNGLSPDGLHLGVYGGDGHRQILRNAANLTDEATRYGANRRNLIWLQTLRRLDRAVARARQG